MILETPYSFRDVRFKPQESMLVTPSHGESGLGHLAEVFASFQGEGAEVGRFQVFARLGGCPLRCRYCDTPGALVAKDHFRVARADGTERTGTNPISAENLAALIDEVDVDRLATQVSVTGGEPLAQVEFLEDFLPRLSPRWVHLETAGVHPLALERVIDHVDIVAMDIKLHSVSGEGDRTAEHRRFLQVAVRKRVFVKVVVSDRTDLVELEAAARLVADIDPKTLFVLQPETNRQTGLPATGAWIPEAYRAARRSLRDVRLIPQTHKFLHIE